MPRHRRSIGRRIALVLALADLSTVALPRATQDAVAEGDTRSLTILHTHSGESATITFRRDGRYDLEGLKQLSWILRDWRNGQATEMEPRLFDAVWEIYREVGSRQPVNIVSAYRSPETNAMLHRRSRAVSERSQHMAGRAMDIRLPDVDTARLRAAAMRAQHGGVGYYPGRDSFVHIDVASVRAWPRMTRDQLARLFPDGKTVHLPSRGSPLPGYELAKAEILARGDMVAGQGGTALAEAGASQPNLIASLFGIVGNADETDDKRAAAEGRSSIQLASRAVALPSLREAPALAPPAPPARAPRASTEPERVAEALEADLRVLFKTAPLAPMGARFVQAGPLHPSGTTAFALWDGGPASLH